MQNQHEDGRRNLDDLALSMKAKNIIPMMSEENPGCVEFVTISRGKKIVHCTVYGVNLFDCDGNRFEDFV